jgi:hypothetical protein
MQQTRNASDPAVQLSRGPGIPIGPTQRDQWQNGRRLDNYKTGCQQFRKITFCILNESAFAASF